MARRKKEQWLSPSAIQLFCRIAAISASLVLAFLILTTPQLDGNREELLMLVLTVILALAGGYRISRNGSQTTEREWPPSHEVRQMLEEIVGAWMEEDGRRKPSKEIDQEDEESERVGT